MPARCFGGGLSEPQALTNHGSLVNSEFFRHADPEQAIRKHGDRAGRVYFSWQFDDAKHLQGHLVWCSGGVWPRIAVNERASNRFDRLRRTRYPIGISIEGIETALIATRLATRENHEPVRFNPDRDFLPGESRYASHRADEVLGFRTVQLQVRKEFSLGAQPILKLPSRSAAAIEKYFVGPVGDVVIGLQQAICEITQGQAFSLWDTPRAFQATVPSL